MSKREMEIARQIRQLKKQGKIRKQPSLEQELDIDEEEDTTAPTTTTRTSQSTNTDVYVAKIRQKLGASKSKLLGYDTDNNNNNNDGNEEMNNNDDDDDYAVEETSLDPNPSEIPSRMTPQFGALPAVEEEEATTRTRSNSVVAATATDTFQKMEDSYSEDDEEGDGEMEDYKATRRTTETEEELSEEELVEIVAAKMQEQRIAAQREKERRMKEEARKKLAELENERREQEQQWQQQNQSPSIASSSQPYTTTGVGGSWKRESPTDATQDLYQPKTGSWGAFPRPRDISKAYGGGRRVGPGYSNEAERMKSEQSTRELLQRYRVNAGIDVQSEKEHAAEIEEALQIANLAMQRGIYSTAVSALEKVTKYCSSNSKVGGKVFLELAMAYEAVGRTQEAIKVYTTLTKCRIEDIKFNAKRLLYGLEAMQFMRDNVGSSEFSRKRAKRTFIDTTGLGDIASKFDDVYETSYIDLSKGFYKKLTESVVRSTREARQILLKATGPGEVDRARIVQALRSLSRRFAEALEKEMEKSVVRESVAVIDGKPIVASKEKDDDPSSLVNVEDFYLANPQQMIENLAGEWRLQLLADKRGDGVKFFNNSIAWQNFDTESMSFTSISPQGFLAVQQSGSIEFNNRKRILKRSSVAISGGGGVLASILGKKSGAVGAISMPQQVVTVDSTLLITRGAPSQRGKVIANEDEKEYFAVWRRVEPGTLSKQTKNQKIQE
jgi:hypothetical protein